MSPGSGNFRRVEYTLSRRRQVVDPARGGLESSAGLRDFTQFDYEIACEDTLRQCLMKTKVWSLLAANGSRQRPAEQQLDAR
jgi:hypothetical protein